MTRILALLGVLACPTFVFAEFTIWSMAVEKSYTVTVTQEALQTSPCWADGEENPPLSARRAIVLATAKKDKLVSDSADWKWHLESASLHQVEEGRWVWLVHFEAYPPSFGGIAGAPPFLNLVVLMDGTIIEPKPASRPH